MREFLSLIIMPVPLLFLLLIAAFFFYLRKKRKIGKVLVLGAGCWALVITTRPVPVLLVRNLESQYPQLSDSVIESLPDSVNIIVLGGGHSDDRGLSPNNQLSGQALGRLVEGIRVYKKVIGNRYSVIGDVSNNEKITPITKIVVSGYSGRSTLTQAEVLYRTAVMLGLDSSEIAVSSLPANTRSEAEEYVKMFGTKSPVVVVTSAIHMPRAVMLFEKAGLRVIPAPTNFILKYGSVKNPWRWVPGAENVQMMEAAVHEYAGLVWAWAGGR